MLRHALRQAAPKKIPTLHLRASQWLEANGFVQEAVKHAFQTQDWVYPAELVERHAWNTILHSQVGTVSEWCRTFPENVIRKHPALCILHAWALIVGSKKDDFPATDARIHQAEAALVEIAPETRAKLVVGAPPLLLHPWVTGQVTLLRSFILTTTPRNQVDPQALIDLGQLAYEQLPVEDIPARSAALLDICYASQARCDAAGAEKKFEHVVGVALSGGNYFGAVVAEYHRAHGLLAQGRLREVIAFCQQKKKTYEAYFEHPIQDMPAIALLDQAQGRAHLELNEIEEADLLLRRGLEVGQWMPREELSAYLALARLCVLKGDLQGMAECLRRQEMRWPDISYCTNVVRVLHNLKIRPEDPENRRTASAWSEANLPEIEPGIIVPGIGPTWNDEADYAVYMAWAEIQIILGKADEALAVIEPILDAALANDLIHRVINLSLLQAQAYFVHGQKNQSWKPLRLALSLAENNGYIIRFAHSPLLVRLLNEAMKVGIALKFIQHSLELNNPDDGLAQTNSGGPEIQRSVRKTVMDGLIEPLSSREVQVLALMAEGLSNAEIAGRLYLSTNTLKAHTQNIFGKLDVHSRVQAVNKARELKII